MSHRNKNAMDWTPALRADVAPALDRIPTGSFLLTSAYGDQRGGVAVTWVQQCCHTPPMVMVAVEKGHALSPVIRDSRAFAVCQLDPADRGLLRAFEQQQPGIDPFMGMPSTNTPSGAPVPSRALGYADCELARHVDIDGDHEIYVGVVHHATVLRSTEGGAPCLCVQCTASLAAAPVNGTAKSRSAAQRAAAHRALALMSGTNGLAPRRGGALPEPTRNGAAREAAGKLDRARKRKAR